MMEVVVTTGLRELQVVQSSSQIITTNKPTSSFFTGRNKLCDAYENIRFLMEVISSLREQEYFSNNSN